MRKIVAVCICVALVLLSFVAFSNATTEPANRVHFSQFDALTFYQYQMTTYRRTSPMPQLKCVSGNCEYANRVTVAQCKKTGTNELGVPQWKCNGPTNGLHFGVVNVNCEGYDRPGDHYVLAGSCSLEYELKGKYLDLSTLNSQPKTTTTQTTRTYYNGYNSMSAGEFFTALIMFVIVFCVIGACCSCCDGPVYIGSSRRERSYPATYPSTYPSTYVSQPIVPVYAPVHSYYPTTVVETTTTTTNDTSFGSMASSIVDALSSSESSGYGGTTTR